MTVQDQASLLFDAPASPAAPIEAAAAPSSGGAAPAPSAHSRVHRSILEPLRQNADYATRVEGPDRGLINAWEAGRMKAKDDPETAARALAGELPILCWKGGVEKAVKVEKTGTLLYMAMWQGLRGEDLLIDMDAEPTMTCSKTRVKVLYTFDMAKLANA